MQERAREEAVVAGVRRRLEAEYGVALPAGRAPLGRTGDGTARQHRFDLVAADRSLVGEVRTYALGEGGNRPSGKFAHCYAACLFLYRTRARRKVLVLTDRAFWSRFRRESEGVVEGIEIIHVPADEAAAIVADEPSQERPTPDPGYPLAGGDLPPRRPTSTARPRGFESANSNPVPRRNRGGPGPRGRRPNTGQRRDGR